MSEFKYVEDIKGSKIELDLAVRFEQLHQLKRIADSLKEISNKGIMVWQNE